MSVLESVKNALAPFTVSGGAAVTDGATATDGKIISNGATVTGGATVSHGEMTGGEPFFIIRREAIKEACLTLKRERGFAYLSDITAVDYQGEKAGARFEVIYNTVRFDSRYNEEMRVFLKVPLDGENLRLETVTTVWKGADWLEREVFDMFGIVFDGHPDMRRILLPDDYEGFPLRKDFDVRDREPAKRSYEKALKEGNF